MRKKFNTNVKMKARNHVAIVAQFRNSAGFMKTCHKDEILSEQEDIDEQLSDSFDGEFRDLDIQRETV